MESPRKAVIVSFGTRGDIKPYCILARALISRGHEVTLVVNANYEKFCRSYNLDVVALPSPLNEADFDTLRALWKRILKFSPAAISDFRRRVGEINGALAGRFKTVYDLCAASDVVLYNTFAFFCAEFARQLQKPSIHVTMQPLLPSGQQSLCLASDRNYGRFLNRLSYETVRIFPLILRGGFRRLAKEHPECGQMGLVPNPITFGLKHSTHLLAFSPFVSPSPGDWRCDTIQTGYWFDRGSSRALPKAVKKFLAQGAPPVYVGFGSMFWNTRRNTDVILAGLKKWGGRAIISTGGGALDLPDDLPSNFLKVGYVEHSYLFPQVAAVVHHGGAGTTAEALHAGVPSVIYPMLGDQMFWGKRVAALGAGPQPVPLAKALPDMFAARLEAVLGSPHFRENAQKVAEVISREPGVSAAVDSIESVLLEGSAARPRELQAPVQIPIQPMGGMEAFGSHRRRANSRFL